MFSEPVLIGVAVVAIVLLAGGGPVLLKILGRKDKSS
jgi:hypothetical protein